MLLMTQRFEVMLEKLCLRGDRERDLPLLFIGERDRSLKNIQGQIDKLKSSHIVFQPVQYINNGGKGKFYSDEGQKKLF